jgi:hypothetical protein
MRAEARRQAHAEKPAQWSGYFWQAFGFRGAKIRARAYTRRGPHSDRAN